MTRSTVRRFFSAFQLHFDPARPEKPIQGWNINLFLMFLAPRTNNSCHLYRRYIATHNSFYTRAPNGARMCVRNLAEWPHGAGKSMRKHRLESINAIKSKHFQLDWVALGGRRHQSTCGAAAASKPVVAYKLNLHVFLLARPRSILGLCGVPKAAGVLSRSASLGILAKKKPKTFKFQKFLPDRDTNAHGFAHNLFH